MTFSTPTLTLLIAAVFGGGSLSVAAFNALIGRGGRRADIASKLVDSSDKLLARFAAELAELDALKAACEVCQGRLLLAEQRITAAEDRERMLTAALRSVIRVIDTNDQTAIMDAIITARQLI